MLIDMGRMVEVEFREFKAKNRGCNVTWFAGQLNCDRRNIYDIFRRPTIDTQLLSQICIVLRHNFFRDIADIIENNAIYSKPDSRSGLSFLSPFYTSPTFLLSEHSLHVSLLTSPFRYSSPSSQDLISCVLTFSI